MIKPKCPRCKIDLKRNKKNGAFYYQCNSCYGSSFTLNNLKKVLPIETVSDIWFQSQNYGKTGDTDCPLCVHPMRKAFPPKKEHVELDVCYSCQNIWFDASELKNFTNNELTNEQFDYLEQQKLDLGSPHFTAYLSIIGLPAEKHQLKLKAFPKVTWTLIVACIILSVMGFGNENFLLSMAFKSINLSIQGILSCFTYFFVHIDYGHLLGNLYFLWVFGDNTEDDLGTANYLILIATATLLSAILLPVFTGKSSILVGASGGIAGVVGYYLTRFPKREFYIFFFLFFTIPAWVFGVFYILKEVFGVYLQLNSATNVSHISHLAGVLVGVLFALYRRRT